MLELGCLAEGERPGEGNTHASGLAECPGEGTRDHGACRGCIEQSDLLQRARTRAGGDRGNAGDHVVRDSGGRVKGNTRSFRDKGRLSDGFSRGAGANSQPTQDSICSVDGSTGEVVLARGHHQIVSAARARNGHAVLIDVVPGDSTDDLFGITRQIGSSSLNSVCNARTVEEFHNVFKV